MTRWSVRQIFVVLLAVLVTVGLSLSAVQAATVMPEAAKMSMMADMKSSGDQGCKQCGSNMDGGKAMVCSPVCVSPLVGSHEGASQPFVREPVQFTASDLWLTGRSPAPDPYPPRPFHIA